MNPFHSLTHRRNIVSDLKVFAKTVEHEVFDQLNQLMSVDVFKDSKIRIMPDTHAGKVCVI